MLSTDSAQESGRSKSGSGSAESSAPRDPNRATPNPPSGPLVHRRSGGALLDAHQSGSMSRLIQDKQLCNVCEKAVSDRLREDAKQKRVLLQRAKSMQAPSIAPPALPGPEPEPGWHSAAPAGLPSSSHRNSRVIARRCSEDPFYFPYSHQWDAGPVRMKDITEDGMPPDQRASDVEHVRLSITVKTASHLPKADAGFGKCDPFILVRFFDQEFRTKTHKMTYDASFEETFSLFVHAANVNLARLEQDADRAASMGLAVEFECLDFDMFGANDPVGSTTVLLQELLEKTQDGSRITIERNLNRQGQAVVGFDGKQTAIVFSCKRVEVDAKRPRLGVVTLESCLAQSDGNASLPVVVSERLSVQDDCGSQEVAAVGAKVVKARFRRSISFYLGQQTEKSVEETVEEKSVHSMPADEDVPDPPDANDMYWRERLEHILESLTVNMLVMLLVLVDIINVAVALLQGSGELTDTQTYITFGVLGLFFVELSARMLAQGRRFYESCWNFFDFVIIYASIGLAAGQYYMEQTAQNSNDALSTARSSATPLRILSRIAMGLRVLRVISHMRKAGKLKGTVSTRLRAAVSQNKRRYLHHGFDLDLTYITDRIIAMSAPALGEHKTYRNDGHVVSRFLSLRHYGSFFVFNLCDTFLSSDGVIGNYHPQMFFNQVQRIPFEDHGPPLLLELVHFCREATKWLRRDPANVMAVHCKGGKGRTGIMIAAFLLWCGHRKCAMDAMELFTFRRTENYDPGAGVDESLGEDAEVGPGKKRKPNRGVDGPSQQRYVFYIEAMLYCGINPLQSSFLLLKNIRISIGAPQHKAWWISYTVKCQRTLTMDSFVQEEATSFGGALRVGQELELPAGVLLEGDTKIEIFRHKTRKDSNRSLLCFVVFHPGFYQNKQEIVFTKKKIDMLHKDTKHKKTDANFKLTLMVASVNADSDATSSIDLDVAMQRGKLPGGDDVGSHRISCLFFRSRASMQQCFRSFGIRHTVRKGEHVFDALSGRSMMLIESGEVECVVTAVPHHTAERGEHRRQHEYHPCGFQIPDEDIGTTTANTKRVPVNMVFGRGRIIGFSNFVSSPQALHYRARTDVVLYVISKSADEESRSKLLDMGPMSSQLRLKLLECERHENSDSGRCSLEDVALDDRHEIRSGVDVPQDEITERQASPLATMRTPTNFKDGSFGGGKCPQRKAWLVRKRLNMVQTWWRVLIVDTATNCIINTIPQCLEKLQLAHDEVPSLTQEQMTQDESTVRKKLDISTVHQIIRYSEDSLMLRLKFNNAQRPYDVEFIDTGQRDEFCLHLAKRIDHSCFVFRKLPPTAARHRMHAQDCRVGDADDHALSGLWQGIAIDLALTLERARTEGIRMSRLKALTDRDSLLLLYDEGEQLRLDCIKKFLLPTSEQMVLHSKCFLASEDEVIYRIARKIVSSQGRIFSRKGADSKRLRIIVLSDHLVFDLSIFGPSISKASILFRLDQLYQVYDSYVSQDDAEASAYKGDSAYSFRMKVLVDSAQGHEIAELTLAFNSAERAQEIRLQLEKLCDRASMLRTKQDMRPLSDPRLESMIARIGIRHQLKQGQEFREARRHDSLFIVDKGTISLSRDKQVYKLVRQGTSFNETAFVKGQLSPQFHAHASSEAPTTEVKWVGVTVFRVFT